jgi:hypothetical protein
MGNLTLTIHFCDISQSFVSATKYENTSITLIYFCNKCHLEQRYFVNLTHINVHRNRVHVNYRALQ